MRRSSSARSQRQFSEAELEFARDALKAAEDFRKDLTSEQRDALLQSVKEAQRRGTMSSIASFFEETDEDTDESTENNLPPLMLQMNRS